jgi:quinolinate synthase
MHVCERSAAWESIGLRVEEQFGNWVDPLIRDRTRYKRIIVHGDAAASVLETADQIGDGVLVIGAQHKRFSDATIIGTTTERITRFARLPVITVIRKAADARMPAERVASQNDATLRPVFPAV